ncbi:MAG: TRAP transporter substrate-binding protein DctP [Desulfatirhabdiaceae bacterium]
MIHDLNEQAIQGRIGRKLRELRTVAGLTAVELALQAGLSQSQISKIETGKAALSISSLTILCQILGRPISYLFQKDEEIPRVLGTMTTVAGPESRGLAWFATEVYRLSNGRLSLVPLQATLLGSQIHQTAMLKEGFLDLFIEDLPAFRELAPALDLLSLPYVFHSTDHQTAFLQSTGFDQMIRQELMLQGIRPINSRWNWRRGQEWVILATRPIIHPDQVKGLKVRIFESPILAHFWKELGAEPVVIPWPKVRRAWLRGEVDLLPTHKTHLYPLGFCRRGRFVTLLGDVSPQLMVAVNEARYNCLPPGIQTALVDSCDAAGEFFSAEVVRSEAENEQINMRRYGVTYLKVDLKPWQTAAGRITRALIPEWPAVRMMWDTIQQIKG